MSDDLAPDGYTVSHDTLVRLGRGDAAAGRRFLRVLIDVEATREPRRGPVAKPPDVRIATEADEGMLLELARRDHADLTRTEPRKRHDAERPAHPDRCAALGGIRSRRLSVPFDDKHVSSMIYAATRERDATIGVVDGPGGPVGMIYLLPEIWWCHPTWYIAERLLYVLPEYRRSRRAARLLQFAQSFVDDMSARLGYTVYLISSVVGTQDVDLKAAVYGRAMTRAGGVFVYPTPGDAALSPEASPIV